MKIAIIPARVGSKRIHKKNIKLFCGKPMITYPIKTALDSKIFDKVVVSTDSEEIAEVARISGAEVPFLRPKSLANDDTATIPVINHAIKNLEDGSDFIDKVCCIFSQSMILLKRKGMRLHKKYTQIIPFPLKILNAYYEFQ